MTSCFGPFHRGIFGSSNRKFRHSLSSSSSSTRSSDSIQDVDMTLIRQIARSSKEYDLEQKIDLELKMQEGTTKLLAACKYQLQSLEAAKSLLTSGERMNAYMLELQRRKAAMKIQNEKPLHADSSPSRAKVAITDIRMPLIWKDSDHFKNRGDYRKFAVFCLFKIGTDVYDSVMISDVDRSLTDIAFEDIVIFNNVPPDFEFHLEVYSHVLHEDLTIGNASNKLKKKISHSVSRTIGKKLVTSMKDDLNNKISGPEFDLVASASLRLKDANTRIKTYDFDIKHVGKASHQLPLFGHFCCRMAVQPECMAEERYSGYLSLVQQIGNITGSRRMWSSLKNFALSMWNNAAEIHRSEPDMVIPVKRETRVSSERNSNDYPQFILKIEQLREETNEEALLAVDSSSELSRWTAALNQHIKEYDLWKPASDFLMEIPSPGPSRNSVFLSNRTSSLYDEIPLTDSSEPSSPGSGSVFLRNSNRLSSPSFNSWSSSSSSASSSNGKQPAPLFRRSTYESIPF